MLSLFRKQYILKPLVMLVISGIGSQLLLPLSAYAVTGGPGQPEMQSFKPAGSSDMVDLFTGDFSYNIPLIDVDGYPVNISYQSAIGADDQASWVGLGWNINPGVISRNKRGLPDDFNGEKVTREFHMKPSKTFGINLAGNIEAFSFNLLGRKFASKASAGFSYNNYTGVALDIGLDIAQKASGGAKPKFNYGLGLSAGSASGVGIKPNVSYNWRVSKFTKDELSTTDYSLGVGAPYNSRSGLRALTFSGTRQKSGLRMDKEKRISIINKSLEVSSTISFVGQTYSPKNDIPMMNLNLSLGFAWGGEFIGSYPKGTLKGYFASQFIRSWKHSFASKAYGYLYLQNVDQSNEEVMRDFNREKDGVYAPETPNLPITNLTYDIYNISGQGIGGMYRPYRSDIGIVYDANVSNISAGLDLAGVKAGTGNTVKFGLDIEVNGTHSNSGDWSEGANKFNDYVYYTKGVNNSLFEPYYFKQVGERTVERDMDLFNRFGGFGPVEVVLGDFGSGDYNTARHTIDTDQGIKYIGEGENKRTQRVTRVQPVTVLNAHQATYFGLSKEIEVFDANDFDYEISGLGDCYLSPQSKLSRKDPSTTMDLDVSDHVSEMTVIRTDGTRYIYGIPAYNYREVDVMFSSNSSEGDVETGLTDYTSDQASKENEEGRNQLFDRTTTPPYAHSYLLTAIVSADYVDVTGNGPTVDDLGTYTKFNYSRVENFRWRTPYTRAYYSEGLKNRTGEDGDDQGSYVYGEKALWYLHSIETKNHVLEFHLNTDSRKDGFDSSGEEVIDNANGKGSIKGRYLERIDLYSKEEKKASPTSAKPIKSVHFVYNYELCPNTPTAQVTGQGKLTLKEVFFTYRNSYKTRQRGYVFAYNSATNYSYNIKSYDRWGNYKPNSITNPNSEFPYTPQGSEADQYAAAWTLSSITLPSGGKIDISYEADDYAYVQDKRAMQLMHIIGSSLYGPDRDHGPASQSSSLITDNLYEGVYENPAGITGFNKESYPYYYLQLSEPVANEAEFERKYLSDENGVRMPYLYFRFLVKMGILVSSKYEYVNGYIPKDDFSFGLCKTGNWGKTGDKYNYAYIKLSAKPLNDNFNAVGVGGMAGDANPIAKAAWNFAKLNLPEIAYGQAVKTDGAIVGVIKSLMSIVEQTAQTIIGFNFMMRAKGSCSEFDIQKSQFRLYNPLSKKKGGGSRVKKVSISDEFGSMTSNQGYSAATYTTEYHYTTTNKNGESISSGVAAYEPLIGGDENPFKQPVYYKAFQLLVPSPDYLMEEPFGETFFPSPQVGYSKVTVINTKGSSPEINQHGTGKTVYEFYTARDFPTITKRTELDPHRINPSPILQLLELGSIDMVAASQGYYIELNDMHGKPKSTKAYAQGDDKTIISGNEYHYKVNPTDPTKLDNNVYTINKAGDVSATPKQVGVDYDMVFDMRQSETYTVGVNSSPNMDGFIAAIFPAAVAMFVTHFSYEDLRFRSVVGTKVVQRYGLVESVTSFDLGASVTVKNMVYDDETGEVVLTETTNQFRDPVYQFNYPAYYAYAGMEPAYKNIGVDVEISEAIAYPLKYFVPGDEISIGLHTGWVKEVHPRLVVVDRNGYEYDMEDMEEDGVDFVRILRSGRRNLLEHKIGQTTTLQYPLMNLDADPALEINFDKVVNAQAIEYTEDWNIFCQCGFGSGSVYNPYIKGKRGIWKVKRSHAYLTGRTQSTLNGNTNIRTDGVYTQFSPFWVPAGGFDWLAQKNGWRYVTEVSIFSPYSNELESRDALNRPSAAVFEYNNQLPVAVGSNTSYRELGFDGFEDYDYYSCDNNDKHFSYNKSLKSDVSEGLKSSTTNVVNNEDVSHSGKRSMELKSNGDFIKIKKVIVPCN